MPSQYGDSECPADVPSVGNGSSGKPSEQPLPSNDPLPLLLEAVTLLVGELREANRNTQMLIAQVALLIPENDPDDDLDDGIPRYLDGTPRN